MRHIDITTTQNVTIKYELAGLQSRFNAFLIDMIILYFTVIILTAIIAPALPGNLISIYFYLFVLPVLFFYILVSEILMDGQTLGKKALKIKVVRLDGKMPSTMDYIIRWAFRLVDILFSLGGIAAILISSTDKSQRLGGIVSNTTVIKLKSSNSIGFEYINKLSQTISHEPKYIGVRQFNESEMLLVKSVVDRYRKFGNKAHQQALNETVQSIMSRLKIESEPKNKVEFLNQVIKDYIVLTR
jgi:uncharacterized RDD family membrane protein YckC